MYAQEIGIKTVAKLAADQPNYKLATSFIYIKEIPI